MSSAKESILEYLFKNFNVFNIERTFNSLTKNLIEEVELNIQNYDIQKNVSETLNNNIYINQNILNSQIIENASNVIKNTLKTEILNENFESIFIQSFHFFCSKP
jgi:hypothetical protein